VELNQEFVAGEYRRLRRAGYALAGAPDDLEHRAAVYFGMYQESGGRNAFPLIAAHGALWARGYLSLGTLAGHFLALQHFYSSAKVVQKFSLIQAFANAFRDLNRRVCAEAYCAYQFTKAYGHTRFAQTMLPAPLLDMLNQCHLSQAQGTEFPGASRRRLFDAFFLWEQGAIATPGVNAAVARFDWPLARWFALRPRVRFAYFTASQALCFKDFSSERERIEQGARAYVLAEQAGFARVEATLRQHVVVPERMEAPRDAGRYVLPMRAARPIRCSALAALFG
jgi:hypothetical protein